MEYYGVLDCTNSRAIQYLMGIMGQWYYNSWQHSSNSYLQWISYYLLIKTLVMYSIFETNFKNIIKTFSDWFLTKHLVNKNLVCLNPEIIRSYAVYCSSVYYFYLSSRDVGHSLQGSVSSLTEEVLPQKSLCISTFFHFPDSGLNLLNGFDFYFNLSWIAWHWKPAIGT